MDNNYYSILLSNIEKLMLERNVNQATLIRETGIPQSQMSKSLSHNKKNHFTFEQVLLLADYFQVSLDSLVGRKKVNLSSDGISNKDICKFFMRLIENNNISYMEITPNEIHFEEELPKMPFDPPYVKKTSPVSYTGFYFSKYFQFEDWTAEDFADYQDDYFHSGNILEKNDEINQFFAYFFKLYKLLQNNDMPRDIFDQAISDRLDRLQK